jgi:hypothetical protein
MFTTRQRRLGSAAGGNVLLLLVRALLVLRLFSPHSDASLGVVAFAPSRAFVPRFVVMKQQSSVAVANSFILTDLTSSAQDEEDAKVLDAQGKEVTVGAVARVCVEGLQAFQISPKGRGRFDDDKNFVPNTDKDTPMGLKYLAVPVGMRGVVNKIYIESEVSANFPIQLKFVPGIHTEEGYDTPQAFLMHFESREVELVD